MANFVQPEEKTYFVESIRPFQVKDVGSPKWLEIHEMIIQLSLQATLEASEYREEEVKEFLISSEKLPVLVHEAYCVQMWKHRILPHLLEVDPNPHATFLIYTVLFYEGAVICLLETTLFHSDGCLALKETAIDLVDYCAQGVAQVIGLVSMGHHENESKIDVDESVLTEIERQKRDLIYKIGLRCISILNYIADNIATLPLSVSRRLVITHDIPWLMADLLQFRPWQRRTKNGMQKYIDEKWTNVTGNKMTKVTKYEVQAWFCMRQILFHQPIMENYELNEERRNHLSKCQGMLNDVVLDQVPPLIELKEFLCRLGVSGLPQNKTKANLVLEEVPTIRENLIKQAERDGGFYQIAQMQESIFLNKETEHIARMAERLSKAYNTDLLADLEVKAMEKEEEEKKKAINDPNGQKYCAACNAIAEKKCGKCLVIFYCSKKCQLDDWPKHSLNCSKASA